MSPEKEEDSLFSIFRQKETPDGLHTPFPPPSAAPGVYGTPAGSAQGKNKQGETEYLQKKVDELEKRLSQVEVLLAATKRQTPASEIKQALVLELEKAHSRIEALEKRIAGLSAGHSGGPAKSAIQPADLENLRAEINRLAAAVSAHDAGLEKKIQEFYSRAKEPDPAPQPAPKAPEPPARERESEIGSMRGRLSEIREALDRLKSK